MSLLAKSRIVLFLLSLLSAGILICIWVSIPANIGLGGLPYIFIESYLSLALSFGVVFAYKKLITILRLPNVSGKWYVFFPVIPNLIIGNLYVVFPLMYSLQYVGLYPRVELTSEAIVQNYSNPAKPVINYNYTVEFNNAIPINYKETSVQFMLAFLGDTRPNTYSYPMLGMEYEKLNLKDGTAEISGTIPIDLFDLHCRNYNFSRKLKLVYNITYPPRPKKTLEVGSDIDQQIKQAHSTLVTRDATVEQSQRVLPECPDWTEKFSE